MSFDCIGDSLSQGTWLLGSAPKIYRSSIRRPAAGIAAEAGRLREKGNWIEGPKLGTTRGHAAIDWLVYFASELASFASYALTLFSQNETVAES